MLLAAAVSAFTGDVPSFAIITVIVLASVVLEHRAEGVAESLCDPVALSARVLRDGKAADIRNVKSPRIFGGRVQLVAMASTSRLLSIFYNAS